VPSIATIKINAEQPLSSATSPSEKDNRSLLEPRQSVSAIKSALSNGQIPAELVDELRIVPLDSESGIKFQASMNEIAQRLAPAWEQEQVPIRFFLMDLPGVNACQIRGANPPLIGFTRGCFYDLQESSKESQKPLRSIDEVALIYAHERGHLRVEREYNTKTSSKLEEGLVSFCAIEVVYKAGLNPEAGMFRSAARLIESAGDFKWAEIIDEHPTPANDKSLYEAALTKLLRENGDIKRESTPLESDHSLAEAARNAVAQTTLDRFLEAKNYSSLTIEQKALTLIEVVSAKTHFAGRRLEELTKEITRLQKEVLKTCRSPEPVLEPLFDKLLDSFNSGNAQAAHRLLLALAPAGLSIKPIGRLAPIASCIENFVSAKDFRTALTAAKELNALIEKEPLIKSLEGINLLRKFGFSQFAFPDVEKLDRNRPQKLSWNTHIDYAAQQHRAAKSDIARALLRIGVDDVRLYSSMDSAVAYAHLVEDSFSISKGPRDGSYTINCLQIRGERAIALETSYSDKKPAMLLSHLLPIANAEFLKACQNPEKPPENLFRLSKKIESLSLGLEEEFSGEHLIGFSQLERNPALFVKLNTEALSRLKIQSIVASSLANLCEQNQPEIVANFFKELGSTLTDLNTTPLDYTNLSSVWQLPIKSSPLLREMMKLPKTVLDAHSRQEIVANTIPLAAWLDSPSAGDSEGESYLNQTGVSNYCALLKELSALFDNCQKDVASPQSWESLTNLLAKEELKKSPLRAEIILLQSALLLSPGYGAVSEPTPAQIRSVLDGLKGAAHKVSTEDLILKNFSQALCQDPKWSVDPAQAIQEWRSCYAAGILPKEGQYEYLNSILSLISEIPSPIERQTCYENLFGKDRYRIRAPELRQQVATSWAQSIVEALGEDDTSSEYLARVSKIALNIADKVSPVDRKFTLNILAEATLSQRELSKFLGDQVAPLSEEIFSRSHNLIVGLEGLTALLIKHSGFRRQIVDFLTAPLCRENIERVTDSMLEYMLEWGGEKLSEDRLKLLEGFSDLHKNFWAAPLDVRALIMREVLLPQSASKAEADEAFEYAIERAFPLSAAHADKIRSWVKDYVRVLPEYSQPFALSALLVAAQRREDEQQGSGFAIASFLESMGPAETKAGQAAQSHPKIPVDIRGDLKRLKTKADQPTRWELFDLIDATGSPELKQDILRVGKLLGSASLYMVVEADLKTGDKCALSLLRPKALERARFGFRVLSDMLLQSTADQEKKYILRELISDANEQVEIETNITHARMQRELAREQYTEMSVEVDGETFSFEVPDIINAGDQFFVSKLAQGEHFIDLPDSERKTKIAKAILALEIQAILSGKPFDNDRHGGNCRISGQTISHFDFGGMLLDQPGPEELRQLGQALTQAALSSKDMKEFVESYFAEVRKISDTQAGAPVLLRRVQKALVSLAEYSDGLNAQDFKSILVSAMQFGIDPSLQEGVLLALTSSDITENLSLEIGELFTTSDETSIRILKNT